MTVNYIRTFYQLVSLNVLISGCSLQPTDLQFRKLFVLLAGPGRGSARLGLRTIAAIIFGRLVLVPCAGLAIVTLADKLGFLPAGDKMFKFVLLLQHTMPTSVLSGIVL